MPVIFFLLSFVSLQAQLISLDGEWEIDKIDSSLAFYGSAKPNSLETLSVVMPSKDTARLLDSLVIRYQVGKITEAAEFGIVLAAKEVWGICFTKTKEKFFIGIHQIDFKAKKDSCLKHLAINQPDSLVWQALAVVFSSQGLLVKCQGQPAVRFNYPAGFPVELRWGLCAKNIDFSCQAVDVYFKDVKAQTWRFPPKTTIYNMKTNIDKSKSSGRHPSLFGF